MKMKDIKISIVVPVYKVEKYLHRCVDSLFKQTYKNLQIILVDDGSPDKCPEICDKYAEIDSRIVVVHQKNRGLSSARNSGIEKVNGDYLMFVDSDDFIELDACERFINVINNHSDDIDLIVGVAKEIRKNKITFQKHTNLKGNYIYTSSEFIQKSVKTDEWFAPAWLNLYNIKWFKKNNLKYAEGLYFEDLEIQPKIFLNANKILYLDYPFYNYVIREGSIMTTEFSDKKKQDCFFIIEEWFSIFSSVENKKLQKACFYFLSHCYLHMVNHGKINTDKYPAGINFKFLFTHSGNLKGLLKTIYFMISARKK